METFFLASFSSCPRLKLWREKNWKTWSSLSEQDSKEDGHVLPLQCQVVFMAEHKTSKDTNASMRQCKEMMALNKGQIVRPGQTVPLS